MPIAAPTALLLVLRPRLTATETIVAVIWEASVALSAMDVRC